MKDRLSADLLFYAISSSPIVLSITLLDDANLC